ncbi:permease-like cell division protein FtsX [Megamonas funiformis]|jgi:cell division transport system permease protein|uniref:permease-like cell division protein FtsX n=1 Tax=Megamonas funiformis TaxID=437897 RepID=UPI000E468AF2|nr:permease-like cell division protein FtsX [Megamonas funiformis]RGW48480.1 ABC transporter permease [Megamonas funiformis]
MKLSTSEYFIKEVYTSFKRNIWMTLASIFTVVLSLFILGFFSIVILNLNKMADTLESQVQISVYLKDDLSQEEIDETKETLSKIEGLQDIKFTTREEAMKNFKERLGDQQFLLDALDDTNPLPDSFSLTVTSPQQVKTIADTAAALDSVESASYSQDIINHLFNLTHLIRLIGIALIILLTGAAIFIISNTIRLTVFARRKEIAIMKYVGATDWFIRWPFLLEGICLGFIGGGLATIFLYIIYNQVTQEIYEAMAFFPLIPQHPFIDYISLAILVAGIIIGALGSTISLKRFLKV